MPTESEIRASATPAAPAVADDGFALEDISTTAGFAEDEEEVGPVGSMEGFETTHLAEELTVPGADLLAADDSDEQEESDEEVTVEVAATLEDSDSGELTDQLEGLPDLEAAFAEDESGDESSEEPALEVEAFDAGEAGEEPSIIIEHDFGDAVHVDIPAFEAGDDDSSPSDVGLAFSDAIQNGADPMDALEDLTAGFEGAAFSDDEAEDSEEDDLVLEAPAFDDLAAFGNEETDEPAFSGASDDEPAFTDDIGGLDLGTDVDFGFGDQDSLSAESLEDSAEEDTAVEGLAEDEMADLPLMSFDDESGLEAEETFDDAGADEDGVSPEPLADLQLDAPAFTSDIVNPFEAPATAEAGDRQGIDDTGLLVAATPDSPSDLMEAGIAALHAGNGEEGVPLLEQAYQGFADVGDFDAAAQAVRELAQHAPNEVEYRQRMVEVAFQLSDDDVLVQAYLDLARCLGENGETDQAASVYQQVLNLDPQNDEASSAVTKAGGEAPAAQVSTSEVSSSEDYVDLGALIFDEDEEEKTTRWFVEMEAPSGDDEADFAKMLSQFKSKVAEHIEADDVRAHYDLGTAYREMGLVDEAIAEFQQALRASGNHLPTYEILGQCFMEKGQYEVAIRSMGRAMDAEYEVEDELLGIYYYLGVAHEELGNVETASEFYERIFSLDINFRDVTERLRALR